MRSSVLALLISFALLAQSNAFEVVSVRPDTLPPMSGMLRMSLAVPRLDAPGGHFTARKTTLQCLLMQAYGLHDFQLSGLPRWALEPDGERYEVQAKAPGGVEPSSDRLQKMLQSLLADRFRLKAHFEAKELPVYVLALVPGGPKMRKMRDDEKIPAWFEAPGHAPSEKSTFDSLVSTISQFADRPVLDETGLSGKYEHPAEGLEEVRQEYRTDRAAAQGRLRSAVAGLGLKLEPHRRNTQILIVEHVDKPSPN